MVVFLVGVRDNLRVRRHQERHHRRQGDEEHIQVQLCPKQSRSVMRPLELQNRHHRRAMKTVLQLFVVEQVFEDIRVGQVPATTTKNEDRGVTQAEEVTHTGGGVGARLCRRGRHKNRHHAIGRRTVYNRTIERRERLTHVLTGDVQASNTRSTKHVSTADERTHEQTKQMTYGSGEIATAGSTCGS